MVKQSLSCQVCKKGIQPPEVGVSDMQLYLEVNTCRMNIFVQFRRTGGETLTLCSECAAFALGSAAEELAASESNESGFLA